MFTARYGLSPYITQMFYNRGGVFTARYGLSPYITQIRFITEMECSLRGTD